MKVLRTKEVYHSGGFLEWNITAYVALISFVLVKAKNKKWLLERDMQYSDPFGGKQTSSCFVKKLCCIQRQVFDRATHFPVAYGIVNN